MLMHMDEDIASIMFTYVYNQQEYITCYEQRISETIVGKSIVVTH
jgi:hypothetical protein